MARKYYGVRKATFAEAADLATQGGCDVVLPASDRLLIDYDRKYHTAASVRRCLADGLLRLFLEGLKPVKMMGWRSRNNGWHVIVDLDASLRFWERIHWQRAFGSDPVREDLALERLKCSEDKGLVSFLLKPKSYTEPKLHVVLADEPPDEDDLPF